MTEEHEQTTCTPEIKSNETGTVGSARTKRLLIDDKAEGIGAWKAASHP